MLRLFFILLGLMFVYAPRSFAAPVAQFPQCGYDFNCFYQQLSLQNQQEKAREKEEAQVNQQTTFVLEEARLGEMEKQTTLMEEQNERANYQDDKIEAQEEEIQSQQAEIENLNQTIDQLKQNQVRSGNSNQRTDSSSSSAESQSPGF